MGANIDKPQERARSILLYELNEVPWQVIDWYIAKKPRSNLRKIIQKSICYTTVTRDVGELHPWVTWPTLHRGVTNQQHGIEFLNQDFAHAADYPPLWETIAAAGKTVGVFASLQSFPPIHDPAYQFYIPDTFSRTSCTIPTQYQTFQQFNLRQTAQDGGIISDFKLNKHLLTDFIRMFGIGLSFGTALRLVKQVTLEKYASVYKSRRSVMQAPIAFDIFLHALARSRPEFVTFFTNHVAGMMHRYWKHAFPEQFGFEITSKIDRVKSKNVEVAMDVADRQIGVLMKIVERSGGTLLIASSMGQEAIDRCGGDQARIVDLDLFMKRLGFDRPWTSNLAMHPDFNFEFIDMEDAALFAQLLERVHFSNGTPIFYKLKIVNNTLNFGLAQPPMDGEDEIVCDHADGRKEPIAFSDAGIMRLQRDIGTAYHQPYGILIWCQPGAPPSQSRPELDSTMVRPMILDALGVDAPRPVA